VRGEPHHSGRRIFAAAGGKKCSNYFQNRAPVRILQAFWAKKSVGGFILNLIQSKRKFFQIIIN